MQLGVIERPTDHENCAPTDDRTKGGVYISEPPSLHLGAGGKTQRPPPFPRLRVKKPSPQANTSARPLRIEKLVLATLHLHQPAQGQTHRVSCRARFDCPWPGVAVRAQSQHTGGRHALEVLPRDKVQRARFQSKPDDALLAKRQGCVSAALRWFVCRKRATADAAPCAA